MMSESKQQQLDHLQRKHRLECAHCTKQTEFNIVFGEGNAEAELMFVGEGPGAEEDRLRRPFVGCSGQLLDREIQAMGLERQDVYIANIVKTRPPGNRVPTYDEAKTCEPYLAEQIAIIQPKVIVTLGATAAKYLLNDLGFAITKRRGKWHSYKGVALMPTFHPAYLLRQVNRDSHAQVWSDLQAVLTKLGLAVPKREPGTHKEL